MKIKTLWHIAFSMKGGVRIYMTKLDGNGGSNQGSGGSGGSSSGSEDK